MRVCWNRQTGTFEGRVSMTYEFKSRHSHQSRASTRRRVVEVLLFYSFFSRVEAASFLLPLDSVTLDPIRLWVRRYFFLLRLDRKRHFFAASLQSRASTRRRVVEALFCGFFNYKNAFGFYLVNTAYMLQCSPKLSPIVSQSFFTRVCSPIM